MRSTLEELPQGLDTILGAGFGGSVGLSGGQWQRLSLARLIYHRAPLLILDEPVASLDPHGERQLFEWLAKWAGNSIVIVTTHRYDTIRNCDRIVVLVDGVVTEQGTHDELLLRQRDYWSLYMLQRGTSRQEAQSGTA